MLLALWSKRRITFIIHLKEVFFCAQKMQDGGTELESTANSR
jgi:hypothetical protein